MEIATYNIAKHLAKRGHEIHVITSLDEGLSKESMEQSFYVHRVGYPKVRILGFIVLHIKLLLLLKRINPDMIHFQNTIQGIQGIIINLLTFIINKVFNKPYSVWCCGYYNLFSPPAKITSKFALKNAHAVIALTEDMKREIQKVCNREVFVIPNGIDLKSFDGLSREHVRRKLKIPNKQKIIVFVGTLRPVKGLKYLIQAMDIIAKHDTLVKLMLVGDGEERQSLQELVKELDLENRVIFMGKVSNEEVPEYMVAADVFVLPSLQEGFGIVNLEAMACGLPIVTTNVKGLPEIVKHGENGLLVEPKNPAQIAEKVLQLLENSELRERISRNNRERVKNYTWERVINSLEEVYKAVRK